jgi:hypothetical protein
VNVAGLKQMPARLIATERRLAISIGFNAAGDLKASPFKTKIQSARAGEQRKDLHEVFPPEGLRTQFPTISKASFNVGRT